jgi:GNAT superfamily N-acetyltransferase
MFIEPLNPGNVADWFDFFDQRAFTDHPDWKGCYCTFPFIPRFPDYPGKSNARKPYAKWLIANGRMKGYLAFEQEKVVGWCNVNRKTALPRFAGPSQEGERILSIACFLIQKEFRRRGIARGMLDRIIADARQDGVSIIEAYPRRETQSEYSNFHGPFSLYEKAGFTVEEINGVKVVRKYLSNP